MKFDRCVLLFVAVALGMGTAYADSPAVTMLTPAGFQRGTETDVLITGARLGDVTELLFYDSGVEVLELKPEGEGKVHAKLKIAETCEPGLHAVRLATSSGISNLRYFGVTSLPQVDEVEPNSDFATPQLLALNSTVNGIVKNEDVDYYLVELAEGQKLTVELEGLRLGTEFFDPFVAILDENRFEVARCDDAPLLQQDCVCAFVAPQAGKYTIEVRESSFGGSDRSQYRLHVGDFPRPLAIIPAGGQPGEKINATLVDASGETWQEEIQLPDTLGEFNYVASRDGKLAPSPNKLRVVELPNVSESEPDDDRATLTAVDVPVAFNGVLQENGDVDWFKFKGKKDQQLEFTVYGRRVLRSPIDSWLEIHKAAGGRLAANDDAGGPDSVQAFKIPEDGEYLVAIRDQLEEGSPTHAYRIEVAPAAVAVELAIDELQRYQSQTVEIPQGAQMAVLLRASRKNFSGDLGLHIEDAIPGIELTTPTIAANQSYIPMLIKASADAPVKACLAALIAEPLAEGASVRGTLNQRTMLVRGQNNRDMWGHDSDRLALAVTRALPFSIKVVQPEVPIVRNGNTEYVVQATRQEGFKEPIYLRSLYNPSGLSASGSVKIEGDQLEARIPVTANAKSALGSYPITILARAKATNSNVWVASEFITLNVEDGYFAFTFAKTVAEAGASAPFTVGLEVKRPPEGEVEFELVGLPAGVTSTQPTVKYTDGMQQISFPLQVAADARVGQFKTLYVKSTITRSGGQIVQTEGLGEIQLIAPPVKTAAAPAKAAAPAAPAAPSEKPLSRLEQLRQAKALLDGTQPNDAQP
ncbi:PPC domain-containing protein [Aureliella helgolandensis]|uniref:Putative subtilase-type serine protease n=1 Tax=Aureliella helgolandensis TaxID=2527968 RepID=A0A518G2M4_9BACT|nr:PPC domain-containing protein [Aureliella helgolandensis]QDV22842.1 putative subtilase-type serine protease precursor [Aureliella helgolandensis]